MAYGRCDFINNSFIHANAWRTSIITLNMKHKLYNLKLYNLEKYEKRNGTWVHCDTVMWAQPYSLCKGMKIQKEGYKSHFEFYKITKNEIKN
jgi:hypothetical protein